MLYSSQGHKAVWSADGNMDYLGSKHAPLFAVAVATLLILWLPYTLLRLNIMMNVVYVRNGVAITVVVISTTGSNVNSTNMYQDTALQS